MLQPDLQRGELATLGTLRVLRYRKTADPICAAFDNAFLKPLFNLAKKYAYFQRDSIILYIKQILN